MANETKVSATMKVDLDGIVHSEDSGVLQFDTTGKNVVRIVQSIATSETALLSVDPVFGGIAAGGYMYLKNLDSTNYIEIRQATSASDFCRLEAGQIALFPTSPDMTAPFAIADTASCDLLVMIVDT